ncbi:MAG TPA: recombinase family protein, partial [Myxococcales bacterium]
MRAAAYLRVSTDGQTNENQRLAVAKFCGERGWTLVRTYEETVSGAAAKRPAFDRLMRDAVNGRGAGWDVLVVVALDRLTRAGARAALEALERARPWCALPVSTARAWQRSQRTPRARPRTAPRYPATARG